MKRIRLLSKVSLICKIVEKYIYNFVRKRTTIFWKGLYWLKKCLSSWKDILWLKWNKILKYKQFQISKTINQTCMFLISSSILDLLKRPTEAIIFFVFFKFDLLEKCSFDANILCINRKIKSSCTSWKNRRKAISPNSLHQVMTLGSKT